MKIPDIFCQQETHSWAQFWPVTEESSFSPSFLKWGLVQLRFLQRLLIFICYPVFFSCSTNEPYESSFVSYRVVLKKRTWPQCESNLRENTEFIAALSPKRLIWMQLTGIRSVWAAERSLRRESCGCWQWFSVDENSKTDFSPCAAEEVMTMDHIYNPVSKVPMNVFLLKCSFFSNWFRQLRQLLSGFVFFCAPAFLFLLLPCNLVSFAFSLKRQRIHSIKVKGRLKDT